MSQRRRCGHAGEVVDDRRRVRAEPAGDADDVEAAEEHPQTVVVVDGRRPAAFVRGAGLPAGHGELGHREVDVAEPEPGRAVGRGNRCRRSSAASRSSRTTSIRSGRRRSTRSSPVGTDRPLTARRRSRQRRGRSHRRRGRSWPRWIGGTARPTPARSRSCAGASRRGDAGHRRARRRQIGGLAGGHVAGQDAHVLLGEGDSLVEHRREQRRDRARRRADRARRRGRRPTAPGPPRGPVRRAPRGADRRARSAVRRSSPRSSTARSGPARRLVRRGSGRSPAGHPPRRRRAGRRPRPSRRASPRRGRGPRPRPPPAGRPARSVAEISAITSAGPLAWAPMSCAGRGRPTDRQPPLGATRPRRDFDHELDGTPDVRVG